MPARRLARHRYIGAAAHVVTLDQEDQQRGDEQDECQGRSLLVVILSRDGQEDLRGKNGDIARDKQRVPQVGQRFHKEQEKRSSNAGNEQRQRDSAKDVQFARAETVCGFFHAGVESFEHGPDDQIGNGEKRYDLDEHEAIHAVNVVAAQAELHSEQFRGDQSVASEEQNCAQGQRKWRRNRGDKRQQVNDPAARRVAPDHGVGKDEAQNSAAGRGQEAHDQGVGKDLPRVRPVIRIKVAGDVFEAQACEPGPRLGRVQKTVGSTAKERKDNEDEQEERTVEQADEKHRVTCDQCEFPVAPDNCAPQATPCRRAVLRAVQGYRHRNPRSGRRTKEGRCQKEEERSAGCLALLRKCYVRQPLLRLRAANCGGPRRRMIFLLPFFPLTYYLSWSAAAISFVNLSTKAFLFLPAQSKS